MRNDSERAMETKTGIAPMLSVRNGAKAVEFYKTAFGAMNCSGSMRQWIGGRSIVRRRSRLLGGG